MNESNCRVWACELVECARAWVAPRSELRQHLRECPECAARWASERNLTTHLQALKEAAAVGQPAQAQRERIMRQFALQRRRTVHPVLRWALAAAAALVLTVGVGSIWRGGGLGALQLFRHAGGSTGTGAWADAAEADGPLVDRLNWAINELDAIIWDARTAGFRSGSSAEPAARLAEPPPI